MIESEMDEKQTLPLLQIRGLTKQFGGVTAVSGVDLDLYEGELVGLIGPNGAGKTTLFNMISGVLKPTSGEITFRGETISNLAPHQIATKGIARTFQANVLFHNLSVLENVLVASYLHSERGYWRGIWNPHTQDDSRMIQKSEEMIELMGLGAYRDELARNLPHGCQRLLGISIALLLNPKLLLLDEPMAGLSPTEIANCLDLMKKTNGKGVSILLVEHDMKAVMKVCTRLVVLNFGTKLCEGLSEQVVKNKAVIEAYLGAT